MAVRTALVTDSTCNLHSALAAEKRIHVAPLYVLWGDTSYKDGIDITEEELFRRLITSTAIPTTSQVSPQDFIDLFQEVRRTENADEIVCGVLSSSLSGTYASAMQAKAAVDFPVHVVDTRKISWSLGFSLLDAAEARDAGASPAEIVSVLTSGAERSHFLFTIDSLEFLHRGGRIGNASRLLGTALNIKPVLEVHGGIVETVDKVRTRKRALSHMIDVLKDRAKGRAILRAGVVHGEAPGDAQQLLDMAVEAFHPRETYLSYLTAVLAVHAGPGAVGISVEWSA